MKNAELIKAVKSFKGKVMVPMLIPNDVAHVVVEKKDLIAYLSVRPDDEQLQIVKKEDGVLFLDTVF